jgi:integrase/recombinase XerD
MITIDLKEANQGVGEKEIKDFLRHCKAQGRSPATLKDYTIKLDRLYHMDMDVDKLLEDLHRRNNANSTINAYLRIIKVFYRFCGEKFEYTFTKEDGKERTPLTKEELEKITKRPKIRNYQQLRTWYAIVLLASTGMRISSATSIKISDVDLKNTQIKFYNGKSRKWQIVPMMDSLVVETKFFLKLRGTEGEDILIPNKYGKKMSPITLSRDIHSYGMENGIYVHAHLLRHTFASTLARKGCNSHIIQRVLGHSTPDITQRYIHLYGEDIKNEFNRIF